MNISRQEGAERGVCVAKEAENKNAKMGDRPIGTQKLSCDSPAFISGESNLSDDLFENIRHFSCL